MKKTAVSIPTPCNLPGCTMPEDQTQLQAFGRAVLQFAIEHPAPVDGSLQVVVEVGATLRIIPNKGDVIAELADQLFRTTKRIDAFIAESRVRS